MCKNVRRTPGPESFLHFFFTNLNFVQFFVLWAPEKSPIFERLVLDPEFVRKTPPREISGKFAKNLWKIVRNLQKVHIFCHPRDPRAQKKHTFYTREMVLIFRKHEFPTWGEKNVHKKFPENAHFVHTYKLPKFPGKFGPLFERLGAFTLFTQVYFLCKFRISPKKTPRIFTFFRESFTADGWENGT